MPLCWLFAPLPYLGNRGVGEAKITNRFIEQKLSLFLHHLMHGRFTSPPIPADGRGKGQAEQGGEGVGGDGVQYALRRTLKGMLPSAMDVLKK